MLRESVKNRIYEALDYDIFRYEDFDIDKKPSDITIHYFEYFYEIKISRGIHIIYSPGQVLKQEDENISMLSFDEDVSSNIHSWLRRVKKELSTSVQQRFFSQQLDEFHSMIDEKLKDMDDSYFSIDEGNELKQRLDELENDFANVNQENAEIKKELNRIKNEIEFLKATVSTLPKKKWFRNAMSKFFAWSQKKENQELIRSGVETIKTISQIDFPDMK